jgi:hypothetical protein
MCQYFKWRWNLTLISTAWSCHPHLDPGPIEPGCCFIIHILTPMSQRAHHLLVNGLLAHLYRHHFCVLQSSQQRLFLFSHNTYFTAITLLWSTLDQSWSIVGRRRSTGRHPWWAGRLDIFCWGSVRLRLAGREQSNCVLGSFPCMGPAAELAGKFLRHQDSLESYQEATCRGCCGTCWEIGWGIHGTC